jgi:hypothetical protein
MTDGTMDATTKHEILAGAALNKLVILADVGSPMLSSCRREPRATLASMGPH